MLLDPSAASEKNKLATEQEVPSPSHTPHASSKDIPPQLPAQSLNKHELSSIVASTLKLHALTSVHPGTSAEKSCGCPPI